jgi:hypothetical protein
VIITQIGGTRPTLGEEAKLARSCRIVAQCRPRVESASRCEKFLLGRKKTAALLRQGESIPLRAFGDTAGACLAAWEYQTMERDLFRTWITSGTLEFGAALGGVSFDLGLYHDGIGRWRAALALIIW